MDDDREESAGLSGWASFQFGLMAAENDRHTSEAVRAVFNRHQPSNDINALLIQNQALVAENRRLRQDLSDYEFNYNNLKAWAGRATAEIKQLRKDRS